MRYLKTCLVMMVLLMSTAIQSSASVQGPTAVTDGSTVYLPSTDGVCSLYTVDGTVTFKAVESGSIPNYKDFGVAFQPANEGDKIMITVNSIDISGGTRLIMYDGDVDISKIGASGAGGASPFNYFPAGWVAEITANDVGYTFTSTTDNGMVAFGCTTRGTTGMTGWDITVTSMSPKDMEYVSTTAITGIANTWRGAKDQEIFGVDVVMDGGGNPLTLDQLTIDASAITGSTQVTNVRLMTGNNVLATGEALTATDVTLKNGHNRFMVVADIQPDANGTIPSLDIQTVKVAGEERTPTATTGDAIVIDNTILMGADATTYTIDNAANFYDDGGKAANITQGFEGQVTFVPATEGQAIKVDFSKLELFNTSTVGYNDVFKFYNGREVNEDNLITTLLDEAEIVKSTAEDGSMTVYLKSTAGTTKAGWEALVSQFLPGDMTFNALTGEAASTATVAAGDKDVQMLVVDVLTDNTSNPLSVTGINLNATDVKNIAKATVYFLGKKNEFATTNKFGEAEVTANAITITGTQELIEGHNYFAIVVDLNEEAENGDEITLSLQDVTVGGTVQTPAEAITATRAVDNICHATQGSHSHNIKGEWKFTHTEGYNGKYETVDADYIVTFTPAIENTVAEIDFSSFDVYYASSSYGTRAVFEIYSGTTLNSENLLWNLKDNSESNVGPGKVIRSTSADGSLTIRFNPKTTSSYYAGTGWMATVRPFQNHEMTVNEVTVNQTSTAILAVGSTDAPLIDFNVQTEGTLTTKTLTGIKLNLTGSDAIEQVKVLYSGAEQTLDNAVEFGSAQPTGDALVITGEKALAEGPNRFWVQIDVKQDADAEVTIDAALTELQFADGNQAVENGNPEGSRVTKAMLIMQPGVNVVTVTKPIRFYDDGGPDENFSAGFDGTITFVPGVENCGIEINAIQFGIGSSTYNKFNVYNGREVNDAALVTTNGTSSPYYATYGPDHLISRAEDGTLTIRFTTSNSSYASQTSGWEIEVYLHEYKALTLDSIKAGAAATDAIVRGSQNNPINKVELVVAHDNNKVSINDLKFNATGVEHIAAAKLYYTGTADGFAANDLFATATVGDELTFTAEQPLELTQNGNYYLWLTYDLKDEAVPGETVGATFVSLTGGVDTTVVESAAAEREIKAGFHGTYTIGSSSEADYPTFAAAIQAMSVGVDGPVRFEVEDGSYAENITIENIAGATAEHNIVFTSKSGNRDNVIVKGSGVVEYVPGSTYYKKGMVYVVNTAYLTFENMSFIPSKQDYPNAIQATDRCHYFTVRGCYLKADPVTSGYSGMNLIRTESGSENNQGNDHMTLEGNTLQGGYIGMYLYGPSKVAHNDQVGAIVKDNVVSETRSKGIYLTDTYDALVEGNTITNSTTTATGYNGMDLYRLTGAFVVRNNVVVNSQSAYSTGIYFREKGGSDDAQNPALVYNNVIAITNAPNNNAAGLQINSQLSNVHVYYNTVYLAGSAGYCYYNAGNDASYSGVKLQNNLFQNATTGGLGVALFYSEENVTKTEMSNNVFYNASSDVIVKDYAEDIDALNTLVGNQTNTVEQATFLSDVDLHLRNQGNLCSAAPVDFITTDADGLDRDPQTPTVGAYEFVELSDETPELAEGYPIVANITENSADVKTKWTVGGKLYSLVVKSTEPGKAAPTAEELKAGTPVSVMADQEVTTSFNNLDEDTQYQAYFLNVSALGNESEIVSAEFKTARHIEPLTATLTGATIETGGEATLAPVVAGGDEPYTYEWTDQMNNSLGTDATLTVQPDYTWGYRVKVTSADGQSVTAKAGVIVRGEQVIATMDDNYLAADTHDEAYDLESDKFYSGSFAFSQGSMPDYNYWYGYCLSNETATSYSSLNDQWRNANGTAHSASNYLVAFPDVYAGTQYIEVTNTAEGDSVMGMYVTNTAYAYNSMANGDGFAEAFKPGSYFTLTVTGTTADRETRSVEFNLGDYRSSESNRYILDTWEWVDLRPLGKVTKLSFAFSGSETNQYGLTTPTYFAMDDLGCMPDVTVAEVDVPLGENMVDLANYFVHADNGARERYYLDDEVDDDVMTVTKDSDDNNLSVNAKQQGKRTMLVYMTAKGHSQWLQLTINVNPTTDVNGINAGREVQSVQYVNAMGQVSDRPFDGVNIVVTRYTDGTVNTKKELSPVRR